MALITALVATILPELEGSSYPRPERECFGQCMYVQVKGLGKADGVHSVDRLTRLGDFLASLGHNAQGPVKDVILEQWSCLDFQSLEGNGAPSIGQMRESDKFLLGFPMDLNRAGVRDLLLLPGIGPGLAKRVVQERRQRGGFQSPEDLSRVKSIPRKTLERIQSMVVVQGEKILSSPYPEMN